MELRDWGFVNIGVNAFGTQTHIIASNATMIEKADARASRNEFEINRVRKSDAARVAVAIHWLECHHWTCWKGDRHGLETTFILQKVLCLVQNVVECHVELARPYHSRTRIAHLLVGGLGQTVNHIFHKLRIQLKFQHNCAKRRKPNPTSADAVIMALRPARIVVKTANVVFDILANA